MRPAVPLYWRAPPAACWPFVRNPVSSTTRTAIRGPQRLDPGGAPSVAKGLGIPSRSSQPMRDSIRGGLAGDVGELPAVFPLHRAAEAPERGPGPPPDFAPCQPGAKAVALPRSATASRAAPSQGARLLGLAPAPATAPWFRPPESVWNHVNIRSTTVVLGGVRHCRPGLGPTVARGAQGRSHACRRYPTRCRDVAGRPHPSAAVCRSLLRPGQWRKCYPGGQRGPAE